MRHRRMQYLRGPTGHHAEAIALRAPLPDRSPWLSDWELQQAHSPVEHCSELHVLQRPCSCSLSKAISALTCATLFLHCVRVTYVMRAEARGARARIERMVRPR